jgi:hypothetical protein
MCNIAIAHDSGLNWPPDEEGTHVKKKGEKHGEKGGKKTSV